jgi:PhnB protein
MAYDVPSVRPWSQGDSPFSVSVRGNDAGEISGYWKLTDGSTVVVDLAPPLGPPLYGMRH